MAVTTFMSPIATFSEIDQSNYTAQSPIGSIGGTVGLFQWGPVEQLVQVGDEKSFSNIFGLPYYKKSTPEYNKYIDWWSCSNFLSYSRNLRVFRACYPHARNALIQLDYHFIRNQFGDVIGLDPSFSAQQVDEFNQNEFLIKNDLVYNELMPNLETKKVAFIAKYPGNKANGLKIAIAGKEGFKNIKDELGESLITNPFVINSIVNRTATIRVAHNNHNFSIGDKVEIKGMQSYDTTVRVDFNWINGIHEIVDVFSTTYDEGYLIEIEIPKGQTLPIVGHENTSTAPPTWSNRFGGSEMVVYKWSNYWSIGYKSLFVSEPVSGEFHILVIDSDGSISGTNIPDTVLEKYENVSASPIKKYDGSSNYIVNVINRGSAWINVGDIAYLTDDFITDNFVLQGGDDSMFNYAYPKDSTFDTKGKRLIFDFLNMEITRGEITIQAESLEYSHIRFRQEGHLCNAGDALVISGYHCAWGKESDSSSEYQYQKDSRAEPIYYPNSFVKVLTSLGTFSYMEDYRVNADGERPRTIVFADSNYYYIEMAAATTVLPPCAIVQIYDCFDGLTNQPVDPNDAAALAAANGGAGTSPTGGNFIRVRTRYPHYFGAPGQTTYGAPNYTPIKFRVSNTLLNGGWDIYSVEGTIIDAFTIELRYNDALRATNPTDSFVYPKFANDEDAINFNSGDTTQDVPGLLAGRTFESRYKGVMGFIERLEPEATSNLLNTSYVTVASSMVHLRRNCTTLLDANEENVIRVATVDSTDSGSLAVRLNAWSKFLDEDTVDANLLFMGGGGPKCAKWVNDNICLVRRDCIVFVDPYYSDCVGVASPTTIIRNLLATRNELGSTSYAEMHSAWKYQYDRFNDEYFWIPMGGDIAGLCSRVDYDYFPWYSPAGLNRGQIKNCIKLSQHEPLYMRDALYINGINPVVSFPNQGTVLYGDKTLQTKPSAFDRINVRRLFIYLERAIVASSKYYLFELNDPYTREALKQEIGSFLAWVKSNRGVYAYKVICDGSNNTPETIDRYELYADIFIQPAKTINFIQLNFIATRTGASMTLATGE